MCSLLRLPGVAPAFIWDSPAALWDLLAPAPMPLRRGAAAGEIRTARLGNAAHPWVLVISRRASNGPPAPGFTPAADTLVVRTKYWLAAPYLVPAGGPFDC
jgi:hypothetical protein